MRWTGQRTAHPSLPIEAFEPGGRPANMLIRGTRRNAPRRRTAIVANRDGFGAWGTLRCILLRGLRRPRQTSVVYHARRTQLPDLRTRRVDEASGEAKRVRHVGGTGDLQPERDAEVTLGVDARVVMHAHPLHPVKTPVAENLAQRPRECAVFAAQASKRIVHWKAAERRVHRTADD